MTPYEFLHLCEDNPEVEKAFRKAVDFSERKRALDFTGVVYFNEVSGRNFTDVYKLAQEYRALLNYPFEAADFREYLLRADRELAENLLSSNCRGETLELVHKVLTEARAMKQAYKKELQELWHSLEMRERAEEVRASPLFTKTPFVAVKFSLTLPPGVARVELEDALLYLFPIHAPKLPHYLILKAWEMLGAEEAAKLFLKARDDGAPDWSLYVWRRYLDEYPRLKDVFLPWAGALLPPAS